MSLSPIQASQLIELAAEARSRAYAPYSHFRVGAAVLADGGAMFAGCNVENASYGLAICAERNAIAQAVVAGKKDLLAIAIVATPLATPCGACRQVIAEFGSEIEVICADADLLSSVRRWTIDQLLPERFSGDDWKRE